MRQFMSKIAAVATIAFAGVGCAGFKHHAAQPAWATQNGAPPLVIAHRGASGYLPEHTIEAYALAIEQGADIIEPDLVVTKDGVLIARHDRFLSTTTNVAGKAAFADRKRADPDPDGEGREDWWAEDFTLAEIKTLRARQPRENRPQDHNDLYEIPTFAEVLALATREAEKKARPVGVYPETKHPGFLQSIGLDFETPLLAALDGFDAGPIFIQSFEPEILKRLKGKTPHKLVQLVYEETPGAGSNIPLAEIAGYADGVGPSKDLILGENADYSGFIDNARRLGLFVHPWTFRNDVPNPQVIYVGEAHGWRHPDGSKAPPSDPVIAEIEYELFFLLGADGVFSDFPDAAVKIRDSMNAAAE